MPACITENVSIKFSREAFTKTNTTNINRADLFGIAEYVFTTHKNLGMTDTVNDMILSLATYVANCTYSNFLLLAS